MTNDVLWDDKVKTIVALCREKGFSKEEYMSICLMADDEDAVDKFGEIEALEIVIEAIKKSNTWEEAMRNVVEDLDAFDVNARPDIIIDP